MAEANGPARARRTGGRSARVRTSVLDATAAELARQGYAAMRIEDIAARAGVHKTTIYRRWPTKAELVIAMVEARSTERVPVPDLGSLEADLHAFATSIIENLARDGASIARAVVAAAATEPELREGAAAFWARRFEVASEMVDRARARDEIPADTSADSLIECLIGPLFVRVLLTDVPLDDGLAQRTAATTAMAARAGGFRTVT